MLVPENKLAHADLLREIGEYITLNILENPLMQNDGQDVSILLSGSTSLGVLDKKSDVDLLVVCEDERYDVICRRYEEAGAIPKGSDFFVDLRLPSGKIGHYTLHKRSELTQGLSNEDMEWLWISHVAHIYHDPLQIMSLLKTCCPLKSEFLNKLRKNTYIQLRTLAKGLDNPVVRGEPFPILFFAVELFKESLRCAITIEGYPYPYDKWLVPVASNMPIGKRVLESAGDFFVYLKDDASYAAMFQEDNNFVRMEKRIRKILLEEFRSRNIDEPWLIEWWKYVEK